MGFRFRKSFKIAPGVKFNLGKKSAGISLGGKYGGMSFNTKSGARARVSAPGTGLSYSTKVGGSKKQSSTGSSGSKNTGSCLMTGLKWCLWLCIIPFYWIYAIIWFIFLRKKLDDNPEEQKKATIKYSVLAGASLLLFLVVPVGDSSDTPSKDTAIVAETESSTEEITVEPKSVPKTSSAAKTPVVVPSAKKETSSNPVEESSSPEAPAEEPTPEKESVVEPVADPVVENTITQPAAEAPDPAPVETPDPAPAETPDPAPVETPSQPASTMVWIDDTAKRYHSKNGCGMDNAYQVTIEEAIAMGKTPCGRCYR